MKNDTKNVTLKTLQTLKAEIYARAKARATELTATTGNVGELAEKLARVQKRADFEASKIAYVIQIVRVRA